MTPNGRTVCLSMIVKDEAHVIARCLASVRPILDHWIVVDTGSTDGTQDVVRAAMAGLPGEVVERPWVDFAHNRSEALALARPRADYSFIIDADDELVLPPGFALPALDADAYVVDIEDSSLSYQRSQLFRNALSWRYVGVLHEYPACEAARDGGHLPIVMRRNHDGARRRNPSTYRRDAALLQHALEGETDPFLISRYTFYLGQSWRDCGETEKALESYMARARLGYWQEEVYVALLQAARLQEALGHSDDDIIATYARATYLVPARAEALHGASRFCRSKDRFEEGYWLARRGAAMLAPSGSLFAEPWVYAYGLLDELGVHAYWSGRYEESRDACARLMQDGKMPEHMRERIEANMRFALEKLAAASGTAGGQSSSWTPARAQGGTELMVEALRRRMGHQLDALNLCINAYDAVARDPRPLVLWMHHDIDQAAVQWRRDEARVAAVTRFVFVSYWQRDRYLASFGLPSERCVVIRHALEQTADVRRWEPAPVLRCAYTSTPFRGLDVLLDAWDRLPPGKAELHIWSSMKLYAGDDAPYLHLLDRARSTTGIVYHGLAPNEELRGSLRGMHILSYPSTFAETACRSVIEAMAAGCRVVVPSHGALPETTGGYARVYPWCADLRRHVEIFAETLGDEIASPWRGRPELALAQQGHCASVYGWSRCIEEWQELIDRLIDGLRPRAPPIDKVAQIERPDMTVVAAPPTDRLHACLARLQERGFSPRVIVDVGAHDGDFSRGIRALFPDAFLLVVDALAEKEPVLQSLCRDLGNAASTIALLGEAESPATSFFVVDTLVRPDLVKTGSSKFRENSAFPMQERSVPQRRLASLLDERDLVCDLIKLDVQGAELDVLRGLGAALERVEVIVMEMSVVDYNEGAPLAAAVLGELERMGFLLLDIVEEHRYRDGSLMQFDGIFVRTHSAFRSKGPFWA